MKKQQQCFNCGIDLTQIVHGGYCSDCEYLLTLPDEDFFSDMREDEYMDMGVDND